MFWISTLASVEFPEIIDYGKLKLFQDILLEDSPDSWTWKLGNKAYELGYTAFNDSPEIGTFITTLKQDYQIDAAIETGVYFGSTTLFFSSHFDDVYAIELAKPLYDRVKARLQHRPNIHLYHGSSEKILSELLPTLKEKRLLFYLDAHSDGYWPLLDELEEISKTHHENCILVIDDIHVPNTDIHGILDGTKELSHEYIRSKLRKIFDRYAIHYLIPKNVSRAAKFVAIPRKWENKNYCGRVEIVSGFSIFDFPVQLQNVKDAGYEIKMQYRYPYDENDSAWDPDLKKIIIFGWPVDSTALAKLPKEKLLYFILEPGKVPDELYQPYSRVYTWDDEQVDNVKFFKLFYPYLMPMRTDLPPFEEKKLCVMVSGSDNEYPERVNELYSERMKMVEFFETKPEGEFDIYGRFWVKRHYRDFRGAIPGDHSGEEKISTLKKYRFSVCFENTKETYGYITEKIFACFAAGCVPIYWGANNIETYIPPQCFIDYRKFKDQEELYQFIKMMPKEVYEQYLQDIRTFLNSEQAQVFSPAHFEKTFYEAISG
ncbi:MAG: hypothetical protein KGJ02_06120 [Verrucomicrobiota bacterium]|nr:hypothetical protein [Verrucomicrobiota bacterium]